MSIRQFVLGQHASRPVSLTAWRSQDAESGLEVGFTGLPDRVTHRLPCRASWEAFATEQGHWQIAAMHWVLGVTFREERTRSAEHSLASNRSWLQRFAITRLSRHSRKDVPKGKLQDCMSDTNFLWEVLGHQGPVHALALGSTRLSLPPLVPNRTVRNSQSARGLSQAEPLRSDLPDRHLPELQRMTASLAKWFLWR